ncbi:putative 7-carboxy-7-deazaguanine synthase QueE [Megasphaera vaginalis (ex Srinivasan et al. 2021)]|uniref:7-carboxy-7-deazaguanine synthase n=1 Tax=Megasphaera vaginalis (ex Srinivasan et al. 2021) TaxID=1111454 RepID=U7UUJ4_9FIRM|nr:putative 7-carboxy-7-deazaguanine synthase QueE [Megasphaera vaginalis (ex Srinivasan et al. 2021)]ERT62574.1 putative 7-cyano-7-deazaguanosine (preQ0) biosynthesis protein QueE [Megasphaera vaginalis (ex Srinivasan et al. 2021)]
MQVAEKFISINGEGPRAGALAVFIRFQGCNLACSYCDTRWANEADCPYEELTPEAITDYVLAAGVTNVTLTGGEPLLQEEMATLLQLFDRRTSCQVEVETNGAVPLAPFCTAGRPYFTLDYKLAGSGCEERMVLENFACLRPGDAVKFVASTEEDLKRAGEVIRRHELTERCTVYISPVFGRIDPKRIVRYMSRERWNGVRLQLQLHKMIWPPDMRGV